MSFTRESKIISAICLIDLAVTLALIQSQYAQEGNPVMGFYLQFGVWAFVLAKLCLLVFPIFIMEWCSQYKPVFTRRMARVLIVAYLGVYALLFIRHNVPQLLAGPIEVDQPPPVTAQSAQISLTPE